MQAQICNQPAGLGDAHESRQLLRCELAHGVEDDDPLAVFDQPRKREAFPPAALTEDAD